MARKSNTEILSKRRYTDTPQGRDVYNRQRLERGQMEDPQTMTSRAILCVIAAVFAFALAFGYRLDLMNALGVAPVGSTAGNSILGTVLTALTLMGGSSAVSELIAKIKN